MAHAEARAAERAVVLSGQLDGNGDGEIVAADLPGPSTDGMLATLDRLDENGDGGERRGHRGGRSAPQARRQAWRPPLRRARLIAAGRLAGCRARMRQVRPMPATDTISEDVFMAAYAGGDAAAATPLARRHAPRVLAVAVRMLGDAAEAGDVTQEVLMRL